MKTNAGLWIDHREAVIVVLTSEGEKTSRIRSDVEKHLRSSGEPGHGSVNSHQAQADDSREREYTGHLAGFYDEIIERLSEVESIVIFGPGEAKGELKKQFEKHPSDTHIIAMETTDKMTEPQIAAFVRHCFHQDPARQ